MSQKERGRVIAAMSGGVDSSVAAALLKDAGYEVIGVTMQIWQRAGEEEKSGGCCSLSAVNDARRVADKLGIPYYVMNFRDLFDKKVINYFTAEYLKGRTPNPCIACNRHIKFEALLDKARALESDYMATGHYARIVYNDDSKRYLLYRAKDDNKDQTYALYTLTQEQLAHTLLPLGDYTKPEIRQMAAEMGLLVADKPDSQEICFVADDNYKNFLEERIPSDRIRPGNFINTRGKVLGKHKGIPYYTVGQRKGLGVALGYPAYVLAINPQDNTIVLGEDKEAFQGTLRSIDNNFIPFDALEGPLEVEAKIRYGAVPAPAVITPGKDGRVLVQFNEPQRAITPGQAVVYYQGDLVVGGGTIDEVVI